MWHAFTVGGSAATYSHCQCPFGSPLYASIINITFQSLIWCVIKAITVKEHMKPQISRLTRNVRFNWLCILLVLRYCGRSITSACNLFVVMLLLWWCCHEQPPFSGGGGKSVTILCNFCAKKIILQSLIFHSICNIFTCLFHY